MRDLRVRRVMRVEELVRDSGDRRWGERLLGIRVEAKTISEAHSESLRSSGSLSSLEIASESITRIWGVAAMVIILVCEVGRVGLVTLERLGYKLECCWRAFEGHFRT